MKGPVHQHPELFELPVVMRYTHLGDGTYKAAPVSVPDGAGDTWVGGRKAAALLGLPWNDGCKSLDRLRETGLIRSRRITPGKIEYELGSLLAHKKACEDSERWNGVKLKREEPKEKE